MLRILRNSTGSRFSTTLREDLTVRNNKSDEGKRNRGKSFHMCQESPDQNTYRGAVSWELDSPIKVGVVNSIIKNLTEAECEGVSIALCASAFSASQR